MQEVWKDIKGYEGLYQVSNKGRVRRLQGKGCKQERVLKPSNSMGYLQVKLYKECKCRTNYIHRLVATAFIKNLQNLPEVNHIDECKTNNSVDNLEWCTRKENINHGTRNERMAKVESKPVIGISKDSKSYLYFNSTHDAQRLSKFDHSSITKCCKGKLKTHKGYVWNYVEE